MRCRPLSLGLGAILLLACAARDGTPAAPCVRVEVEYAATHSIFEPPLDVLLVVGGSGASAEQHASRVRGLERLVRILVTGDWNEDGVLERAADFLPPTDVRIGVVSTHMGSGGYVVSGCEPHAFGEDGRWRALECGRELPEFLAYGAASDADYASAFVTCHAAQPSCPIEQPLEAALKALSPAAPSGYTASEYVPPRFLGDTTGHGDGANGYFLRPDSHLAVIVLSGADDCSARDVSVYDPASHDGASEELACAMRPDALHPIERFVEGLLALRPRAELSLSFIAGVPEDLAPSSGDALDYERLLSTDPAVRDPRMQLRPDDGDPSRLAAACQSVSRGRGATAVRLIETARALAAHREGAVGVASVCADDYRGAIEPIVRSIRSRIGWGSCLPSPRLMGAHCELELSPPTGVGCDAIPGSTQVADEADRAACIVPLLEPTLDERAAGVLPAGPGWLVDDYTREAEWDCGQDGGRVVVLPRPPSGTSPRFRCLLPIGPSEHLGTFCEPGTHLPPDRNPCPYLEASAPLACDPFAGACGVACASNDDCGAAQLPGYTCDLRPLGELDPLRFAGDAAPRGFCVSPTCE